LKLKLYRVVVWLVFILFFMAIAVEGFNPVPPGNAPFYGRQNPRNKEAIAENGKLRSGGPHFEEYAIVKHYSQVYGIDFRLMLALIKQESQFNNEAVSERGAIGLMQLMPVTNAEVAENLDLEGLRHPAANIKSGIYYFTKLLELFKDCEPDDQLCLALAAYNAGPSRIYDAQVLAAYMGENPNRWSTIQNVLPLLSKRYYSLHQAVWGEGKPKSGFFGGWRQTVYYVDQIMKIYGSYKDGIS